MVKQVIIHYVKILIWFVPPDSQLFNVNGEIEGYSIFGYNYANQVDEKCFYLLIITYTNIS